MNIGWNPFGTSRTAREHSIQQYQLKTMDATKTLEKLQSVQSQALSLTLIRALRKLAKPASNPI